VPNCTDHTCSEPENDVSCILLAVADHFTKVRSTETLTPDTLAVTIGAEAYNAGGRSIGGRSAELARGAHAAAPDVAGGITRGEYALRLRLQFAAPRHEWSDDDNQPVIPTIPGPRRAPQPQDPQQPGGPTCCGRPMRRDGQQFVCGTCGGWTDSGVER
jgi:hypothetical protein